MSTLMALVLLAIIVRPDLQIQLQSKPNQVITLFPKPLNKVHVKQGLTLIIIMQPHALHVLRGSSVHLPPPMLQLFVLKGHIVLTALSMPSSVHLVPTQEQLVFQRFLIVSPALLECTAPKLESLNLLVLAMQDTTVIPAQFQLYKQVGALLVASVQKAITVQRDRELL